MDENLTELETVPLLLAPVVGPPPLRAALSRELRQERQVGGFLCWAAAAVAVAHFFDAASDLTQCKMATIMRIKRDGSGECCPFTDPVSLSCDQVENTADVLKEIRLLANMLTGPLAFDQVILQELGQDRPVLIGKGNHVIVVYGATRDFTGAVTLESFDPGKDLLYRMLLLTGNEHEIEALCLTKPKNS